jgi:hypothetical protein
LSLSQYITAKSPKSSDIEINKLKFTHLTKKEKKLEIRIPIPSKTLPPYLHVTSIAMPAVHTEWNMVSLTAALGVLCLAHVKLDET